MRHFRLLTVAALLILVSSSPASADATIFIGSSTTPANRQVRGFAIGAGLAIVGVEFEYASTSEDPSTGSPRLRTGMGNVYVQTPVEIAGLRFYAIAGAGVYRESLADTRQESHLGFNTGGGVKISLLGPLKARLDYRAFKLRGTPLYSTTHRIYAGLNLSF